MLLTAVARTRLEKAAVDNGFDLDLGADERWLRYGSTQAPLRLWLSALGDGFFVVAMSQGNVLTALDGLGALITSPIPQGAAGARSVADIPALHHLLRRAFQLSRTLPNELLHLFEARVAGLPRATEAERLVVQRVGQDVFREGLLNPWEGRCSVTGLAVTELLRASHIKPWAACETDAERLDVFNGLLLAPHLDAAFDRGFITVADDGEVVVSGRLDGQARAALGLTGPLRVARLTGEHRRYLSWHRKLVFADRLVSAW
jgi:putative restriction endonuclease